MWHSGLWKTAHSFSWHRLPASSLLTCTALLKASSGPCQDCMPWDLSDWWQMLRVELWDTVRRVKMKIIFWKIKWLVKSRFRGLWYLPAKVACTKRKLVDWTRIAADICFHYLLIYCCCCFFYHLPKTMINAHHKLAEPKWCLKIAYCFHSSQTHPKCYFYEKQVNFNILEVIATKYLIFYLIKG